MKYIKSFESKITNPRIGDYVIIDPYTYPEEVSDWILNHIGRIIGIDTLEELYIVEYENIPEEWKGHFSYEKDELENVRKTPRFGIEHFSKSKKKLELMLATNKYNL